MIKSAEKTNKAGLCNTIKKPEEGTRTVENNPSQNRRTNHSSETPKTKITDSQVLQYISSVDLDLLERFSKAKSNCRTNTRTQSYWSIVANKIAAEARDSFNIELFLDALELMIDACEDGKKPDFFNIALISYLKNRTHISEIKQLSTEIYLRKSEKAPDNKSLLNTVRGIIFENFQDIPNPALKLRDCQSILRTSTSSAYDITFYKETAQVLEEKITKIKMPISENEHKKVQTLRIYIGYCWYQCLSLSTWDVKDKSSIERAPKHAKLFVEMIQTINMDRINEDGKVFPTYFKQWKSQIKPIQEIVASTSNVINADEEDQESLRLSHDWDLLTKALLPFLLTKEIAFSLIAHCICHAHKNLRREDINSEYIENIIKQRLQSSPLGVVTEDLINFKIAIMGQYLGKEFSY